MIVEGGKYLRLAQQVTALIHPRDGVSIAFSHGSQAIVDDTKKEASIFL